ncbi:hypothetical protein LTR37_016571 [Vermiconidia calcicola]|uniref:Uncharacterized protein n=1 Tax=Vermiconidia calcicola TaxID=1690605 RepID=A0ACC3MMJ2_9PEZI|nr:hypothetical protein LTR37_016571 [Vermiconidia calcicola]
MDAPSAPLPFWGGVTSAVNFCEEDYIVTHFIAEFFNTLSSLAYIGYGYLGIQRVKRQDISPFAAVNLPYWGLIGVGIFSTIYHSTLKYHTQMADEMSMHLATGCVLIQLYTFQQPPEIQRRNATIIVVGLTSFVIYHCVTDEFVLHLALFLALCITVAWKTRKVNHEKVTDESHRKKISSLTTLATSLALFAYLLWNIDYHFCSTLTRWKHQIGMPWAFVLELHSWWHILTAVSSYAFMAIIEFLTTPEGDASHGVGFLWPAKAVFEEIVPNRLMNGQASKKGKKRMANGFANGSANKYANGSANESVRKEKHIA